MMRILARVPRGGPTFVLTLATVAAAACKGGPEALVGTITSGVTGEPLVRAVVYEAGTLNQTVTDESGQFSLVPEGPGPQILVQALGYQEQNVAPGPEGAPLAIEMDALWAEDALRASAAQQWDSDFEVDIGIPTYAGEDKPIVYIDEGHHNAHTANGRYRTFADILRQDGFHVVQFGSAFTAPALDGADVLVVATPIDGMEAGTLTTNSPYKPEEVANLHDWVESGGSLLVISDHLPIPGALAPLLEAFEVLGDNGYAMEFIDDEAVPSPIVFRSQDGSLAPHPIKQGRDDTERIDSVATFTGFAFQASEAFRPLLIFGENAWSLQPSGWFDVSRDDPRIPVEGWYHAAAAEIGQGRIVVIGEAAMFTAQVRGPNRFRNGLSSPEAGQNARFLLNVMHWLEGSLH